MSWLENLQEARLAKGVTLKWVVEHSGVPERTVMRTFSGKNSPSIATLQPICNVLGVSLDDILSGTRTVISAEDVPTLLQKIERLKNEITELTARIDSLTAENGILSEQVSHYISDNTILQVKLDMKDEIIKAKDELLMVLEHYRNK